nr:hypothetical protein [Burkholderia cenocepacia]
MGREQHGGRQQCARIGQRLFRDRRGRHGSRQ